MGRLGFFRKELMEHQRHLSVRPFHLLTAGGQREIGLVVRRAVSLADPAAGRDVVGAAGHGVAGEVIISLRKIRPLPGLSHQAYPFPVVTLRVVHAVHIEGAELFVRHDDGIGFHIIGKILVGDAVVYRAVQVLKEDGGAAVHGAQLLPPGPLVELRFAAIDADHIRDLHGIGQELTHIGHVVVEGGDHLGPVPQTGEPERVQLLNAPHGVVLQNHAGGLVLILQRLQARGGELLFVLQHNQDALALRQGSGIPFLLAVLTADDQGFAAVGEALIPQDREAERRLAAFQESGDQVYRYKSANHK